MGKHGQFKRKRRTIDLNSLGKKQRKIYREGNKKWKNNKDEREEIEEEQEDITNNEEQEEEQAEDSSEDEANPFQQFVATFSTKQEAAIDTDEEDSEDESEEKEEDDDEEEEESQQKLDEKIKKLEAKLKKYADDSDFEDNSSDEDDGDDVDDDKNDDDDDDAEEEKEGEEDSDEEENVDQEESSEDEIELSAKDEESGNDFSLNSGDPFVAHFEKDLEDKDVDEMTSCAKCKQENVKIAGLGETKYSWTCDRQIQKLPHRKEKDLVKHHVIESLCKTVTEMSPVTSSKDSLDGLSSFQTGIFSIMNNYQDLLHTERTTDNGEEIRFTYCLHAVNHVLKTRRRVIQNHTKITKREGSTEDIDYRDQGLTRPKVLMVLPFRDSAAKCVEIMTELLGSTDKKLVDNKKRFFEEYGDDPGDKPKNSRKPEDFQKLFTGNCDDHFRIGIGIAKKTLKLYTQFYKADIIIASPLGLRTLIKTDVEKDRDFDFLNSIEVLVVDQADVLMMQNWEHVLHLMNHMHLQPKESHGVDFSRVRMWTLNGWSKFYRQSLIFSAFSLPEVNALFNKHCYNYTGKYTCVRRPPTGTICQVDVQVPQVFHRIECSSYVHVADDRFKFFIKKVLPPHFDSLMAQTLIYIPSYFDFVRIRNHFTRQEIKYSAVNEYTRGKDVNTARNLFFQKHVPFMLYTERFHFFKRVSLTGIRHIIFYGLPQYPHFYSEMCNMVQNHIGSAKGDNNTCTVMYTKYEAQRLAEIVGSERAGKMLHSEKCVHMFVTGEND